MIIWSIGQGVAARLGEWVVDEPKKVVEKKEDEKQQENVEEENEKEGAGI